MMETLSARLLDEFTISMAEMLTRKLNTVWSRGVSVEELDPREVLLSSKEAHGVAVDYMASLEVAGYERFEGGFTIFLRKVAEPGWSREDGTVLVRTVGLSL